MSQCCCRYSFGNAFHSTYNTATHSAHQNNESETKCIKTMDELFSRSLYARRHGTTAECNKDENKTRQMEKETKHLNSVDEIIMCALWPLLYMYRFVAQTGLHSAILLLPPLWLWGIVLVFSSLARPDINPIFNVFRSMNRSLAVRFQLLPVTGVGSHYNIVAICVLGYFSARKKPRTFRRQLTGDWRPNEIEKNNHDDITIGLLFLNSQTLSPSRAIFWKIKNRSML